MWLLLSIRQVLNMISNSIAKPVQGSPPCVLQRHQKGPDARLRTQSGPRETNALRPSDVAPRRRATGRRAWAALTGATPKWTPAGPRGAAAAPAQTRARRPVRPSAWAGLEAGCSRRGGALYMPCHHEALAPRQVVSSSMHVHVPSHAADTRPHA
jgi:hypothetical protein